MRTVLVSSFVLMAGCKAAHEMPRSICALPPNLASWAGTDVRWKGVVVGSFNHGFAMVAEDCQRRGIKLKAWSSAELDKALTKRGLQAGLLRVEVSGRIVGRDTGYGLRVTRVHHIAFQQMTDKAEADYWKAKGF